jgi:hypothetical protein
VVGLPLSGGTYPEGSIATDSKPTKDQLRTLHQCIKKVNFRSTVKQKLCFTSSHINTFLTLPQKWMKLIGDGGD